MNDLVLKSSSRTTARLIASAIAAGAVVIAFYAISWQLGDLAAGAAGPNDPTAPEMAGMAVSLAPSDPMARWLHAATLSAGAVVPGTDPVREFEDLVRGAPNDYRWRIELGRALEQEERSAEAEQSFRKAVELAPSYSHPRWALGNFYLRQGRNDEAVAELKKAADNNSVYRDQVFSLAWDLFGKDPAVVETLAGERTAARVRLAYFFAARGRGADSLRVWNQLSDAERAENPDTAKAIAHGLFLQKHFPESLQFARSLGFDEDAAPEAFTNGSFEKGLTEDKDSRFGWQVIRTDPKFDASADGKVKKDGDRSLKVTFRTFNKPALNNLIQTVVVEPGKRYRVSFWVRTENLKSAGGPLLEIVNANDDATIVRSAAFPTGSNDWQQFNVDFTSPDNCTAIIVRTIRNYCGEDCPLTGLFWYDGFVIARI